MIEDDNFHTRALDSPYARMHNVKPLIMSPSNNQKANHKLVKKCLNYAFFVERQEIIFHTSNNVRPLIIPAVRKVKK